MLSILCQFWELDLCFFYLPANSFFYSFLAFYPLLKAIGKRHWKEIADLGWRFFLPPGVWLPQRHRVLSGLSSLHWSASVCTSSASGFPAVLCQASIGLYDNCCPSISHFTSATFTILNSISPALINIISHLPSEDAQRFLRLWSDIN